MDVRLKRSLAVLFCSVVAGNAMTLSACKNGNGSNDDRCVDFQLLRGHAYEPGNVVLMFKLETCDGEPVPGITADNLVLREDDVVLSPAETGQILLASTMGYDWFTVLLLDVSGSALDFDTLPDLQEALRWLIEQVTDEQRVGIYLFDGRADVEVLVPVTTDAALLRNGIDSLSTYTPVDPSTNLNGAVLSGLALLDSLAVGSDAPVKAGTMVLFTDGVDQAGRVSDAEAESAVRNSGRNVHAVGLGSGVDSVHLTAIGKDGWHFANVPAGLIGQFDDVGESMQLAAGTYYILAYCTLKRARQHLVTLGVEGREGTLGFAFTADGFQAGCSTADIAASCASRECGLVNGALWCGACQAGETCTPEGQCM